MTVLQVVVSHFIPSCEFQYGFSVAVGSSKRFTYPARSARRWFSSSIIFHNLLCACPVVLCAGLCAMGWSASGAWAEPEQTWGQYGDAKNTKRHREHGHNGYYYNPHNPPPYDGNWCDSSAPWADYSAKEASKHGTSAKSKGQPIKSEANEAEAKSRPETKQKQSWKRNPKPLQQQERTQKKRSRLRRHATIAKQNLQIHPGP